MGLIYKGKPVTGQRGPAGPDGNPIGTILSYLGNTPPQDYLICDGTIYNIPDYPDLADFFEAQFGKKNFFGGNGTGTFAVPDMRNLFLRGYHGSSEILSGGIGVKQPATEHMNFNSKHQPNEWVGIYVPIANSKVSNSVNNMDKAIGISYDSFYFNASGDPDGGYTGPSKYTSRPVNMAVLFCIKATKSIPIDMTDYVTVEMLEEALANIQPQTAQIQFLDNDIYATDKPCFFYSNFEVDVSENFNVNTYQDIEFLEGEVIVEDASS